MSKIPPPPPKPQPQTIGDVIQQKAAEYIEIFEYYRHDPKFQYQADGLALHDLQMAVYINQRALEIVQTHIAQAEAQKLQANLAHNNIKTTAGYVAQTDSEPTQ